MIARLVSIALASLILGPQTNELLCPCGMSQVELSGRLREMSDLAPDFLDAEKETGLNAVLLASICALESGWGTSWAAETRNNLAGVMDADGSLRYFDSKRDCIFYVARLLVDEYLSEDGAYYYDGSLESIAEVYSESGAWAEKVREIMELIGGEADAVQGEV